MKMPLIWGSAYFSLTVRQAVVISRISVFHYFIMSLNGICAFVRTTTNRHATVTDCL